MAVHLGLILFLISSAHASPIARCQYPLYKTCVDFTGNLWRQNPDQAQSLCLAEDGIYAAGASCPSESRQGRCLIEKGQETEFEINFYPPNQEAQVRETCQNIGGEYRR